MSKTLKAITRLALASAVAATLAAYSPTEAQAAEVDCLTVEITHQTLDDGYVSPKEASRTNTATEDNGMRAAIVGQFVWFQWLDTGEWDSYGDHDTLSFDVSDPTVERAIGCVDGSVEIVHAQPEAPTEAPADDPAPEPTLEPTTTPLTPYCEVHPDTLARYCTLGNQVLVVS